VPHGKDEVSVLRTLRVRDLEPDIRIFARDKKALDQPVFEVAMVIFLLWLVSTMPAPVRPVTAVVFIGSPRPSESSSSLTVSCAMA
jgi:hypothetical protein